MTVSTRNQTLPGSRNGSDPAPPAPRLSELQLLDAGQVAKLLGLPKSFVYQEARAWVESGGARGIPCVPLGRYRRFRPQAIRDYLEDLEGSPTKETRPHGTST